MITLPNTFIDGYHFLNTGYCLTSSFSSILCCCPFFLIKASFCFYIRPTICSILCPGSLLCSSSLSISTSDTRVYLNNRFYRSSAVVRGSVYCSSTDFIDYFFAYPRVFVCETSNGWIYSIFPTPVGFWLLLKNVNCLSFFLNTLLGA